jgi:hypothetical protein
MKHVCSFVTLLIVFFGIAGAEQNRSPEDMTIEEILKELEGNWVGHGAGEEVRFRDPNGLLILTVKHNTEFFFHVDEEGKIEGEGTIEYELERNTTGLDNLAATVRGLMGLTPMPSAPGSGPKSGVAGKMGDQAMDVSGVTQIQYDAPHLKYGKEIRRFKFTGRIEDGRWTKIDKDLNYAGNDIKTKEKLVDLDEVLNFTLVDGTPNNTLVAEYEVNKIKEESNFPCWSPFLKEAGVLRRGPGGIWVAEFQEQGTHRNEVRVWEEYGYIWMARKSN